MGSPWQYHLNELFSYADVRDFRFSFAPHLSQNQVHFYNPQVDSHNASFTGSVQALRAEVQDAYSRSQSPTLQYFPSLIVEPDPAFHYDNTPSALQPNATHLLSEPQLTPVCFQVIVIAHRIHFSFPFHNSPQSIEISVPQNPYKPYGKDFVANYPPIQFINDFMEGMLLRDALEGKYQGLWGRDDSMFVGFGSSISLRIQVRTFANTFQACLHLSNSFPLSQDQGL
jgi:hypothetical protein